jgi:hypothetical protein
MLTNPTREELEVSIELLEIGQGFNVNVYGDVYRVELKSFGCVAYWIHPDSSWNPCTPNETIGWSSELYIFDVIENDSLGRAVTRR